ncbi:hypothetical protein ALC57_05826 [Trachymyrmex cornetzi]|uniref:Uncharacterized protein n=1 Tax=Trachymyrmex cornetzi TaxID=471704 RepID=A0A151J9S4_9HYME|nr:hypothetical protein ALC57_05826 [Trachymyrmex cornetzi]
MVVRDSEGSYPHRIKWNE